MNIEQPKKLKTFSKSNILIKNFILDAFEAIYGNMAIDSLHTHRLLDYILENYSLRLKIKL